MKSLTDKFNDRWMPEPFSGCWLWTAGIAGNGYGYICTKSRMQYAHRVSWMIHFGDIPNGKHVCHHCDTPACVNPDHLFIGTIQDNKRDAMNKGRIPHGRNHWISKLSEAVVANIFVDKRTHREIARDYNVCRECVTHIKQGKTWKHVTNKMPKD